MRNTTYFPVVPLALACLLFLCRDGHDSAQHTVDLLNQYKVPTDSTSFLKIKPILHDKLQQLGYTLLSASSDSEIVDVVVHLCKNASCAGRIDTTASYSIRTTVTNAKNDTEDCRMQMESTGGISSFAINAPNDTFAVLGLPSEPIADKSMQAKLDSLARFYLTVLTIHSYERDILTKKGTGYLLSYAYLPNSYLKKHFVYDPYINLYLDAGLQLRSISFGR